MKYVTVDAFISVDDMVYIFKYNSAHARFICEVSSKNGKLVASGIEISIFSEYIF
jgi:glyceraldehyde 3-phosphate dehydrogenase